MLSSRPHDCDGGPAAHRPVVIGKFSTKPNIDACRRTRKVIIHRSNKGTVNVFERSSGTAGGKVTGIYKVGDARAALVEDPSSQKSREAKETKDLPFDVISREILVRLPVKSLLRFKCVAKQWRSSIEDERFVKKHMNRAAPVLVRDYEEITAAGTTMRSYCNSKGFWGYEVIGIFDGLVIQRIWDKYFVKNPATMRILTLPNPLGDSHQMWFDHDPVSGDPKLLCEYKMMVGDFVAAKGYQILTIGKDEHWRLLTRARGEDVLMASVEQHDMHFLRLSQTGQGRGVELRVNTFDIRSERFTSNDFPLGVFPDMSRVFPFWWIKRLAVGDFTEEELRVVVLKKRGARHQWDVRREIAVPLSFLSERVYVKEKLVPVSAESDDLWFHYDGVCKFCYDMKTAKVKGIGILANEKREAATFEYRPSLKTLKGMKPVITFWEWKA